MSPFVDEIPTPMLAKAALAVPTGDGWQYEPKWDGFRAIVDRRNGLTLHSRSGKPLDRYFPELLEPCTDAIPDGAIVDSEIIIPTEFGCDFDLLTGRIHPAASRVERLSVESPAVLVGFDLLAADGNDLRSDPLRERRIHLENLFGTAVPGESVLLSPTTRISAEAERWFSEFEGAGLDGIVAKPLDDPYVGGSRGWIKVKHHRSADCVVAGYRMHKDGVGVGALLLGLHDDAGVLQFVGAVGALSAAARRKLRETFAADELADEDGHPWLGEQAESSGARVPGELNRWNGKKNRDWVALRPVRVAEVEFDQLQAGRFRHNAKLQRWRPDRDPASCTFAQLDVARSRPFADLFG